MLEKAKKMVSLDNPIRLLTHYVRGVLANYMYKNPARSMIVIGVTGTNGKTTTTNLIAKGLKAAGKKVFMFSTINYMIDDEEFTNNMKMTSPSPFVLQGLLAMAKVKGCEYAVIETSSHSILMYRNWGIDYDIAVLTNITQDHLDLHRTMDAYVQTKLKLFKGLITSYRKTGIKKTAIINTESAYSDLFTSEAYDILYTYGKDMKATLRAENIEHGIESTEFDIKTAGKQLHIQTKLRGYFNVYNLLAGAGVFLALGLEPDEIKSALGATTGVPGRMEEVENKEGYKIFIDYAHTPDALDQVLNTLKEMSGVKRIITVFGATGDRDRTKRPEMGRIVSLLSDVVILTQDDDYTENTERIIKDVLPGINRKEGEDFWVIPTRREAIRTALLWAEKNDAILIAGKGDEHLLMTNDGPVEWHDKVVTLEILKEIDGNKIIA